MEFSITAPKTSQLSGNLTGGNGAHFSDQLLEKAHADTGIVLKELGSQLNGLSQAEADSRVKQRFMSYSYVRASEP